MEFNRHKDRQRACFSADPVYGGMAEENRILATSKIMKTVEICNGMCYNSMS